MTRTIFIILILILTISCAGTKEASRTIVNYPVSESTISELFSLKNK